MSNPIKILSWNTCWGCQKADETSKNDATSTFLANQCYKLKQSTKVPQCQDNVEKLIIPNATNEYDIIFLQEYVKTSLEDTLIKRGYDLCKGQVMDEGIATFFKADRFKKLNTTDIIDNIQTDGKAGRGFQIIFVQDKMTNEYYALLNIHNGKKIKESYKDGLEKRISIILNDNIEVLEQVVTNYHTINNFNIIFGGDFNDGGDNERADINVDITRNYWKGLKPFSWLETSLISSSPNVKRVITNLTNIEVKIQGDAKNYIPPKTCCTGRTGIRSKTPDDKGTQGETSALAPKDREGDNLYGDYILISEGLEYKEPIQTLPEQQNPSADHLAVTCTIKLKQTTGGSITSNYLDKYLKYKNKYLSLKKLIN